MKKLLLCLISVLLSSLVYADNCHRTIQNNSNQTWYFRFIPYYGGIHFTPNTCSEGRRCPVPPHATVNIEYTHTGGWERGAVYIYEDGWSGRGKMFDYTNAVVGSRCPHILHSGATGAVSLNEPAEGDFVIEKDQWED